MSKITRRDFFQRTGMAAAGGIAIPGLLSASLRAETEPNWITKPEWLNLTRESAIEPELPIIDPHHHLWDGSQLADRYMLEELIEDTRDHNIRQTVFVECSAMYRADGLEEFRVVGETEFVQGVAAMSASGAYGEMRAATGIVGAANLCLGERVAAVLEAQIAASPQRFRGIRQRAAWGDSSYIRALGGWPSTPANLPKRILLDSDFRKGYAQLRTYGLSFEGWVFHTHIDDLTDLAKAFPDTTIIFNHLGGPIGVESYSGRRNEVFAAWKLSVAELAKCPNVVAKLGGLQMIVNGYDWHKRDKPPTSDQLLETNRDWYNYTIDQFGPDRCMFESNFPVDKLSCSYTVLWNQFKKLTKNFSKDERADMFHDTAMRVYRLTRV
ncbi:amidohydrolase family protein [Candidatus Pelagisphaera phototrophica]|uniref:amidohydrolase family protein n=1 Tax=Candidatus Pelagisphaera phototrophica TaxID=2684113 RepID=UPI0024B73A46|nr:amidohydrolase family protein [Candidatus Pelagisphaera phototrophica]